MLPVSRFCNWFLVGCFVFSMAMAALPEKTEGESRTVTVDFKPAERSMIVVPVSVNGEGPYDFLLDTGCAKTIVDRKLARELRLPSAGEKTVIGVLAVKKLLVGHVNSVAVGGATVVDGEVFIADRASSAGGKVRGVLGEDFLRNFDVLIDYRQRKIRLETAPGSMATAAVGERIPVRFTASVAGGQTRNRLIVTGRAEELGEAPLQWLLDSGTNQVTVFREDIGGDDTAEIRTASFSHWVSSTVPVRRIRSLEVGSRSMRDVTAIALPGRADADTDGLLPLSLFGSVLISHRGGFVILEPSFGEGK